ncbi:hypothetical protein Ciccas_013277 [Cichlidogyrus casuarinus]|uniref:Uncharacterized protein n=1 Tax=Cichlidogyrus casuarinus TaxID=1844966 RepID=A0ABD2PL08_9PLAT
MESLPDTIQETVHRVMKQRKTNVSAGRSDIAESDGRFWSIQSLLFAILDFEWDGKKRAASSELEEEGADFLEHHSQGWALIMIRDPKK